MADRTWTPIELAVIAALILGIVGCAAGAAIAGTAFYRA